MRSVRLTYLPTGTDFTIGPTTSDVAEAIVREVYQRCPPGILECREHDDSAALAHLRDPGDSRVHGAYVYLQRRRLVEDGELHWVVHHQGSNSPELKLPAHHVPVMSDEHRRQQEYYQRACEAAGHRAELEYPIPGARLDVAAIAVTASGRVGRVGFEVQHSELSSRKAVSRDEKADRAGIPLVWSADRRHPDWAFKVAHVETNRLEGVRPLRSWTVSSGPRVIYWARCTAVNQAQYAFTCTRDPHRRGISCGRFHPYFRPMSGLVVDDIAEQVPEGDLVRLDTSPHPQGVVLVKPGDLERWRSAEPEDLAARIPRPRSRTERMDQEGCGYASNRVERQVLEARRAAADPEPLPPLCRRCCTSDCDHLPELAWHPCPRPEGCEVRTPEEEAEVRAVEAKGSRRRGAVRRRRR